MEMLLVWLYSFPSQHLNFLLFLPDSVVLGIGLQLQGPGAGLIPKQETLTLLLNFYTRIPKGLMTGCLFTSFGKIGVDSEHSYIT